MALTLSEGMNEPTMVISKTVGLALSLSLVLIHVLSMKWI